MKSVLISIQPKWVELITSGKKNIEVRKTRPSIETPFKCYIYETKGLCDTPTFMDEEGHCSYRGRGQVIGEFVCGRIYKLHHVVHQVYGIDMSEKDVPDNLETCLTVGEIYTYGNGKRLYGWHISDLEIYDTPKELGEFRNFVDCENTARLCSMCKYSRRDSQGILDCDNRVIRPPQSWQYIEVAI